jgi:diadenosine tetraphosphate (Ap4A) HIT family hydrolase
LDVCRLFFVHFYRAVEPELSGLDFEMAQLMRAAILAEDSSVGGFNFGSDNGPVAGRKIPHAHLNLIPHRAREEPPSHPKV